LKEIESARISLNKLCRERASYLNLEAIAFDAVTLPNGGYLQRLVRGTQALEYRTELMDGRKMAQAENCLSNSQSVVDWFSSLSLK
jgi:hypothetical protein